MHLAVVAFLALISSDPPSEADALRAAIDATPGVAGVNVGQPYALRSVACVPFDEEPSEYSCRFEMRIADAPWQPKVAIISYDDGWLLLDWEIGE